MNRFLRLYPAWALTVPRTRGDEPRSDLFVNAFDSRSPHPRGWTGKRAWRLDTIFRTNIQTAYNAGRYHQMQQVKERRPYWRYSAVNDSRTRPAHRAVHGKIFPADHPFWDTWYPPNGFRCRCSVNSVSAHDLELEGWKVETTDPTGKLYEPTDPVTGVKLPARLLMPDEGWRFNPGKEWQKSLDETLGTKLATLQPDIAQGVFADSVNRLAVETDKRFSEWVAAVHANIKPDGTVMTTGARETVWFIEPAITEALAARHKKQLQSSLITITDKKLLHSEHLENLASGTGRKPERIVTPEQVAAMPKLVREAKAVLYDTQNPALLYVFNTDVVGESGKWVVRVDMADKKMKDVTNAVTTGAILPDADILDKIKSGMYSILKGEV